MQGEMHAKASAKVLDAVTDCLNEGLIGDGSSKGMILSYVCVVEMMDSRGQSRIATLWNDERSTVLLGLLSYGHMAVQGGMNAGTPAD